MAKKKKQQNNYLPLLSALLGIVAVVMIFFTAVNYTAVKGISKLEDVTQYTGLQTAFGYSEGSGIKVEVLKFSIMNLLPWLLALGGAVVSVFCYLSKGSKLFALISAGCFIVSAVFFFIYPSFIVLPELSIFVKDNFSLAWGTIVAGIVSALAGLVSLATVVKK